MAPFKLKFRMGSSRSTSQEHDPDPQVNEALLNHHATATGTSSSTLDSADCTSLGSLSTNERKSLLPHKSNNLRLGYLNPNNSAQCTTTNGSSAGSGTGAGTGAGAATAAVPQTPPPSYEHVLEESTRLVSTFDLCPPQRQASGSNSKVAQHSNRQNSGGQHHLRQNIHLSSLEEALTQCTDPDCLENFANEQQQELAAAQRKCSGNNNNSQNTHNGQQNSHKSSNSRSNNNKDNDNNELKQHRLQRQQEIEQDNDLHAQLALADDCSLREEDNESDDNRKESIDSTELLISRNMTAPSSQENLLDNCNDEECQNGAQYCDCSDSRCSQADSSNNGGDKDFCDPLINHNGYCSNDNHHYSNEGHCELSCNQYADRRSESESDDGCWENSQVSNTYQQQQQKHTQRQEQQQHHHQQQQQHHQQKHHQQKHHQQKHQQQYEQQYQEQQQYQHQQQQQQYQQEQQHQYQQEQQQQYQQQYNAQQEQRSQTPEIISNKSSKEIYKDLAKKWGITCKMSDGCRCMECQSHYFDCEYDDNEHHKTDGGLGAGTPMFISEVMHGTACNIL